MNFRLVFSVVLAVTSWALAGSSLNPFLPLRNGATWTYQSRSPSEKRSPFTYSVVKLTPTGAITRYRSETSTLERRWNCLGTGCVPLDFDPYFTAYFFPPDPDFSSIKVAGVVIPPAAQWRAGYTWSYKIEAKRNVDDPDERSGKRLETLVFDVKLRIEARESLQVPAGKFTAFRVRSTQKISTFAGNDTTKTPSSVIDWSTLVWFAKDVGVVKIKDASNVVSELASFKPGSGR